MSGKGSGKKPSSSPSSSPSPSSSSSSSSSSSKSNAKGKQPANAPSSSGKSSGSSSSSSSNNNNASGSSSGSNGPSAPTPPAYQIKNWTGKTPSTLLNELCQRQQWSKPIYETHNSKGKHRVSIILTKEDKKTKQPLRLELHPQELFEHAMEAKHMAAVYALHRVNSHVAMERVLPPDFRDYWIALDKLKKEDTQGLWPAPGADPFIPTAKPAPEEEQARQQAQAQRQLEKLQREESINMPTLQLSEEHRSAIEKLIKQAQYEEQQMSSDNDNEGESLIQNGSPKDPLHKSLCDELVQLGFDKSHVHEALDTVAAEKSSAHSPASLRSHMLSWLCLHVPEADLPLQFKSSTSQLGSSQHDSASLAQSYMQQRLTELGFDKAAVKEALAACSFDEDAALHLLIACLVNPQAPMEDVPQATHVSQRFTDVDVESARASVDEEIMALESIYGLPISRQRPSDGKIASHMKKPSSGVVFILKLQSYVYQIGLTVEKVPGLVELEIRFPPTTCLYPIEPPVVIVKAAHWTSQVRLTVMKQINEFAQTLAPSPSMYSLIDWVHTNVADVAANPMTLRSLQPSMGASSLQASASSLSLPLEQQQQQQRQQPAGSPAGKKKKRTTFAALSSQPSLSQSLLQGFQQKASTASFKSIAEKRSKLPAHSFKDTIVKAIASNQVVIVSGETGCGKTTQVPQFVYDSFLLDRKGSECRIVCTQPRRISALSVAERVAFERDEPVGGTVGYTVRLDSKYSATDTRLLFCTLGIFLRMLHDDPSVEGISHIVIDEVHERGIESDFVLIAMKQLLAKRPRLRLVLMSATVDSDTFSSYFGGAPVVTIPGFTHPVELLYLEDVAKLPNCEDAIPPQRAKKRVDGKAGSAASSSSSSSSSSASTSASSDKQPDSLAAPEPLLDDEQPLNANLVAAVVDHICAKRPPVEAVLIFVSGMQEIKACMQAISETTKKSELLLVPLHSTLSTAEQKRVFSTPPPNVRKVVVSTNIAETSVTVDGIVHVIDTGRHKETQFDGQTGMSCLVDTWVSQAAARQRKGRAGRTQPGICYRLYSRRRHDSFEGHQKPEILRVPLQQICLQVKSMGAHDVRKFLARALTPPDTSAVSHALQTLVDLGAIRKSDEALTPLGHHLALIPVDARIAKVLIYGAIFHCLDPMLTVAASMGFRSPFMSSMDRRDEADRARRDFAVGKSDLLAVALAFAQWQSCGKPIVAGLSESSGLFVPESELAASGARDTSGSSSGGNGDDSGSYASRTRLRRKFCDDHFLSFTTLQNIADLRKQFLDILVEIGFVPEAMKHHRKSSSGVSHFANLNRFSNNIKVLKAVLCAGLYPNVARVVLPEITYQQVQHGAVVKDATSAELRIKLADGSLAWVHPSSVNFSLLRMEDKFLVFNEKVKTSKVYLRETTVVSAYPLLLFGGGLVVDHEKSLLTMDEWIKVKASAKISTLINELRKLFDAILARKISQPQLQIHDSTVAQAIVSLIQSEGY